MTSSFPWSRPSPNLIGRDADPGRRADGPPPPLAPPACPPPTLRLDAVADPAAIADLWRAAEAGAIAVPFQSCDWVATWIAAGALPKGARPLIVVGRLADALALVLPLVVERRGPVTLARRLGGSHASYLLGVWRPEAFAAIDPAELAARLADLGRAEGIDAFALDSVPRHWQGRANPLARAFPARPTHADAYAFRLDPSFDRLLAARNAGHKRKKLKQKEKLLAAAGDYRVATATTVAEVEATLAAFFAQKAASLAAHGIADPFAEPGIREAWRRLAVASLGRPEPLLELTRLEAGGAIRAVIGATLGGGRLFALFASHAEDDLARASPGETLFFRHIEAASARGLAVYDMGQGSERYKASWCDERIELVDLALALTAKGRLLLALVGLVGRLRAAIRRNDAVWAVVRRLRARLAGRPTPTADD